MIVLRQLFSRRWIGGTILVLVVVALFVRLGFWQLDRLDQRRAQNAVLQETLNAPPLDLAQPLPDTPEALENRLVTVSGEYDFAQERIVLLQTWQGRPGVVLLTPLLIEGEGNTAVLVNRGWVPQADYDAGQLSRHQTATGVVQVDGYLARSQPNRAQTGEPAGAEIYRMDIDAIADALPYDLLPVILVDAPPDDALDLEPPLRAPRQVDLSEGPHLGYAWQWFIFAVMTAGLYVYFVRRSSVERPFPSQTSHENEPE
ncbi:MAG: SURF1 family protein [Anaerolineaceae bacterium]|nr:SURF1 family protein [Anaerolineaceae bacterium]